MKQSEFIKQSHIDAKLIRAVIKQSGGWESFTEMASDVCNHGASGGFNGWIYHTETCEFYAKNRKLICELAQDLASDIGEDMLTMVSNFNDIKGDYSTVEVGQTIFGNKSQHDTQIANALAWFAIEEVCRSYFDLVEGD